MGWRRRTASHWQRNASLVIHSWRTSSYWQRNSSPHGKFMDWMFVFAFFGFEITSASRRRRNGRALLGACCWCDVSSVSRGGSNGGAPLGACCWCDISSACCRRSNRRAPLGAIPSFEITSSSRRRYGRAPLINSCLPEGTSGIRNTTFDLESPFPCFDSFRFVFVPFDLLARGTKLVNFRFQYRLSFFHDQCHSSYSSFLFLANHRDSEFRVWLQKNF